MTIGLTEDARDLRDSVRGWAARHVGPDVVRAAVNAKADEKPPYWLDLGAQGLLGLYVPEELGGGPVPVCSNWPSSWRSWAAP